MATKRMANLPGTTDRRIDALLTLLAENSTIVISGAKIAKEIGVTRQQVWRWIEKLRALGVRVKGHPRTGYHIERVPDILAPADAEPSPCTARRLRGAFITFLKSIRRTRWRCSWAKQGEPHGAVVLAEEQTAGRGRAGRSWISEKSAGIHCTRPAAAADSARACAATRRWSQASRRATLPPRNSTPLPDIRWPNDLLVRGRKFSRHPDRNARGA